MLYSSPNHLSQTQTWPHVSFLCLSTLWVASPLQFLCHPVCPLRLLGSSKHSPAQTQCGLACISTFVRIMLCVLCSVHVVLPPSPPPYLPGHLRCIFSILLPLQWLEGSAAPSPGLQREESVIPSLHLERCNSSSSGVSPRKGDGLIAEAMECLQDSKGPPWLGIQCNASGVFPPSPCLHPPSFSLRHIY